MEGCGHWEGSTAASSNKAAAVAFLTALPHGEMQQLLLRSEPGAAGALLLTLTAAAPAETAEPEQELLALTHTAA